MSDSNWWGTKDSERLIHRTPDEAIEEMLDQVPCPIDDFGEVVVAEYAPMKCSADAERVLERLLESLDDEYGDPDGDYTEPTDSMKQAAEAFVRAVVAEYTPWACEPTGNEVRVNALDWVREHRPDWLTTSEPQTGSNDE